MNHSDMTRGICQQLYLWSLSQRRTKLLKLWDTLCCIGVALLWAEDSKTERLESNPNEGQSLPSWADDIHMFYLAPQ